MEQVLHDILCSKALLFILGIAGGLGFIGTAAALALSPNRANFVRMITSYLLWLLVPAVAVLAVALIKK